MKSPAALAARTLALPNEGGPLVLRPSFPSDSIQVVLFTLARLCLVPLILISFLKLPGLTAAGIVLFVGLDIFDGILARDKNVDGPSRRALDSIVDRIGIDAGILGAYLTGLLPLPLLAALLLRDAYCALICARMMHRRSVAIKADWVYRALNLCVALGAISASFISASLWVAFAGGLLLLSIAVAVDLTRCVRAVEALSPDVRDAVIPARSLRAGRLEQQ